MARRMCSECGREIPKKDWSCPHCGNPGEATPGRQIGNEISAKGMMIMLVLFVVFPVLLFLLHIFVPNM